MGLLGRGQKLRKCIRTTSRDNRDADLAVVPKANMLSDKCRDVRPWWGRRLYAAPRRGPRLVGQSSFQKANQRDAVTPRVVDGPSLKAVGRKRGWPCAPRPPVFCPQAPARPHARRDAHDPCTPPAPQTERPIG